MGSEKKFLTDDIAVKKNISLQIEIFHRSTKEVGEKSPSHQNIKVSPFKVILDLKCLNFKSGE